ncbi:MAG: pro-sigmaK processing inhibitor BofA family protein [Oscillospiraceae bacterium]|nr:pro-sigmaK processing inhibitor BofA family protein [Oscillospiraceae bacterium]
MLSFQNIAVIIIVVLALFLLIKLVASSIGKFLKFILHALLGFVLMLVVSLLGIPISITWPKLLVSGLFGVPGVIILILLSFMA